MATTKDGGRVERGSLVSQEPEKLKGGELERKESLALGKRRKRTNSKLSFVTLTNFFPMSFIRATSHRTARGFIPKPCHNA